MKVYLGVLGLVLVLGWSLTLMGAEIDIRQFDNIQVEDQRLDRISQEYAKNRDFDEEARYLEMAISAAKKRAAPAEDINNLKIKLAGSYVELGRIHDARKMLKEVHGQEISIKKLIF